MICAVFQAQIVNIPDPNFKSLLLTNSATFAVHINGYYTVIDTNHDGEIQVTEAAKIKSLNLDKMIIPNSSYYFDNIVSMEGIKSFTKLESLTIDNFLLLPSLDISDNTYLYTLNISRCYALSSINIQGCSQLYDLDIFMANLPSINLSGLTNLYSVDIQLSQLYNIYLNNNTNLNSLNLGVNNLQSLPVSQTPNLKYLNIYNNKFITQDFSSFSKLEGITCTTNKFTSLNLSQNSNLLSFSCDSNPYLQSLFIKNGINNFTQNNNSTFSNTPNLVYICADDSEISNVSSLLPSASTCVVNSYCSFTPGGIFYTIQGNTKYDSNNNGCDINDISKAYQKFNISNGVTAGSSISNSSGNYSILVAAGTHTVTPILENPAYFNISPSTFTANFPTQTSPLTQNFCLTVNGVHNDLEVAIIPVTAASPGFNAKYKIIYKNKGTNTQSGTLAFNYNDNVMDYLTATVNPNSQSAGLLNWNFTNLLPFETREITVTLKLNTPTQTPPLNGGTILNYTTQINGATDETPSDNTFTLNQTVVNSFDPNDKTCLEGTSITQAKVGDYVHYLIRFENTGTANAQNIVVKDDIDGTKFDASSLIALSASHNFTTKITANTVEFIFENIQLPFDNATNDGYISFKIKTKSTLNLGDSFSNKAGIYFDYNAPIITNNYTTTVQNVLGTSEIRKETNNITIYPNPVKDALNIQSKNEIVKAEIYDVAGRILISTSVKGNSINVSELSKGNYIIKLSTKDKTFTQKFIKN
jgi:uncharacterized repeat protein (TIGR01451 family)